MSTGQTCQLEQVFGDGNADIPAVRGNPGQRQYGSKPSSCHTGPGCTSLGPALRRRRHLGTLRRHLTSRGFEPWVQYHLEPRATPALWVPPGNTVWPGLHGLQHEAAAPPIVNSELRPPYDHLGRRVPRFGCPAATLAGAVIAGRAFLAPAGCAAGILQGWAGHTAPGSLRLVLVVRCGHPSARSTPTRPRYRAFSQPLVRRLLPD